MTDTPIIFSAPMVRALLDGRKMQTRRLAWRSETDKWRMSFVYDGEKPPFPSRLAKGFGVQMAGAYWLLPTPWQRVKVGDRLWVRERLSRQQGEFLGIKQNIIQASYAADGAEVLNKHGFNLPPWWRGAGDLTPLHMPRVASRLTLVVTATKIERIQKISEAGARAEGCVGRLGPNPDFPDEWDPSPAEEFQELWKSLHGADSWQTNPEVVALTFSVHRTNIDALKVAA
jgi:hypothetical protein